MAYCKKRPGGMTQPLLRQRSGARVVQLLHGLATHMGFPNFSTVPQLRPFE